jgi:signal transduction histidine kinase
MSSSAAYTLLGLTAIVAALVGILAFALMKFVAAAREARGQGASGGDRTSAVAEALANVAAHAHVDQALAAQARDATAFRLRVAERTRALQAAIDALGTSADARATLRFLAASLSDLVRNYEPSPSPVDLKTVVDVAVSGSRITARARGGDLVVQGEFATVVDQADALDFVLGGIVSAALDSCLRAGVAPVLAIRGERDLASRRVRLVIDDNGPERSAAMDTDTIAGVLERTGGRLHVTESPMGGSRICVDLPIAPST